MELKNSSINDIRKALDGKEISVKELTDEYYSRIESADKKLDCFITLSKEQAYKACDKAQEKINKGEASLLTGIPMAIKDNICTEGVKTTCASRMLENFIPPYNATVIYRRVRYKRIRNIGYSMGVRRGSHKRLYRRLSRTEIRHNARRICGNDKQNRAILTRKINILNNF